jgi:hypothetical protein
MERIRLTKEDNHLSPFEQEIYDTYVLGVLVVLSTCVMIIDIWE